DRRDARDSPAERPEDHREGDEKEHGIDPGEDSFDESIRSGTEIRQDRSAHVPDGRGIVSVVLEHALPGLDPRAISEIGYILLDRCPALGREWVGKALLEALRIPEDVGRRDELVLREIADLARLDPVAESILHFRDAGSFVDAGVSHLREIFRPD